jgi:septal ring factor EnvC (AmiA/AmiB activator)
MAALLLLTGRALAGEGDAPPPSGSMARGAGDGRTTLAHQLAQEIQTIEKTLATVAEKLTAADSTRLQRVRAAYRILRAPLTDASATDRMASARRRAAARLLLDRDRDERDLLVTEIARLHAAHTAKLEASAQVPTITLPEEIARPVRGSILRRFGTLEHEPSRTTLSRRGLDFDVEINAPASAPADGVVRYAGRIRGLDHGVILDHGDYLTVVAKLAEVAIPVGTHVERGDRIGRASRSRVYLEVRAKVGAGGLPIDPEPLLATGPR